MKNNIVQLPERRLKLDTSVIDKRAAKLAEVATILKSELFGLDKIIDQVIKSINAWYTFPELIQRPVIVSLWGLTGVGKTQLVRRLAHLLEYGHRFVEVQMDGITSSSSSHHTTISNLLSNSSIEEGNPGILLLDEFQRYRTVDQMGQDVKLERFQDVWMLLSDGKFSADSSMFRELEMMLAYAAYEESIAIEDAPTTKKGKKTLEEERAKPKRMLYPYEAGRFKKMLRMTQSIQEIMQMSPITLMGMVNELAADKTNSQRDYSKLLIFVSGNLDEAFHSANAGEDCDTDADVYHKRTKSITVRDIKKALKKRFRPEQISRFGNNHIIYPSMSKGTYQKLIESTCQQYMDSMTGITGISFTLDEDSRTVIYENSVYPVQGTRPVFSSIHKIFSDGLVNMAFWAIKHDIHHVDLRISSERSVLIGESAHGTYEVPVVLDVEDQKRKAGEDFKTLVAVHEAGHAIVYSLLFKKPPQEIKINTISYTGGYMLPEVNESFDLVSRADILDNLAVMYAGRAAEQLVFGDAAITEGAASDIAKATELASDYVRAYAMSNIAGLETQPTEGRNVEALIPSFELNTVVNKLLLDQRDRATNILSGNKHLMVRLVHALLAGETIQSEQFVQLFPEMDLSRASFSYVESWKKFVDP